MINPVGMTLTQWCDSVILAVGDAWSYPVLGDEAHWQDWAVSFLRAPIFGPQTPPDPYQFSDWRDWAERVYPMLEVG